MKKMKKNRKISKVGLYTILIVFAIGLTIYPQTSSRYNSNEWDKLIYHSKLSELYVKGAVRAEWAANNFSENLVYFDVTFNRNLNVPMQKKDVYNLSFIKKMEDGSVKKDGELCEVVWVKKSSTGEEQFSFPLEYTTNQEDTITARIRCKVDAITDVAADDKTWYVFNIVVKEQIDDDDYPFVYSDYDYKRVYTNTEICPTHPEIFTISNTSTTKLNDFLDKLSSYATCTTWESVDSLFTGKLNHYFQKSFTTEESMCTSIPGLDIECTNLPDTNETQFKLTAKPTLPGYARTKYAYDDGRSEYMFITSTVKEDLEEVFHYYLQTYVYPESSQSVDLIHNYLHRFGSTFKLGEETVVEGGTRYRVIAVDELTKKEVILYGVLYSPTNRLLVADPMLLNYAYNVKNNLIVIPAIDSFDMVDLFNKGLILVYNDWMTSKLETAIKADTRIRSSYTTNQEGATIKDIDDYYITAAINDDNTTQYVMTHIYSNSTTVSQAADGTDQRYTVAELSIVDIDNINATMFPTAPKEIRLASLTTDYQVDDGAILTNLVTKLNTYFGQEGTTVTFTEGGRSATLGVYPVPSTYTVSADEEPNEVVENTSNE